MKSGIAASKGYAIGRVIIKSNQEIWISDELITDSIAEKEKLATAVRECKKQLENLRKQAATSMGEEQARIFDAHIMLLDDIELIDAIHYEIEVHKLNAMKAVSKAAGRFIARLEKIEDEYLKERATDLKDVVNRLIANLSGVGTDRVGMDFSINGENLVLVAHELAPSDTVMLDKSKVIAFLTDLGGYTSHTAIMARSLEIPAVVGMGDITKAVKNGDLVIVDGFEGKVIINPGNEELADYRRKISVYCKEQTGLRRLAGAKAENKQGKRVVVAGNIGRPDDVYQVIENGGDGVGLFRTEFLYMSQDREPDEEEQFESYRFVLEKMGGKKVVIRTVDIGGDKRPSYMKLPAEMNPFLGYRAIRLCLEQRELFKRQLRALLRASVYGNLSVMFPMISGVGEYLTAMEIVEECKRELDASGIPYSDNIEWGTMIEIPSAALCAEELAKHADFFSIGTNDLIQYTLAVDRNNDKVAHIYDPMHPAVLRLIKMTIDAAHKHGKWVGMCGEMAGDEKAIPLLLEYGLDEFSVNPSSVLQLKRMIMEL
ncbi:MAG: phosphoenolpyruvate--protein phosphotransferase [Clostridiales bacterium]|nr:phosphoenolpyruvate--protein phosphotransferase [Clostridiales bacterium]